MSWSTRRLAPAVVALAAAGVAGPALAHAFLETASPKVGARLQSAPAEVRLSFSEPIEPSFSSIAVTGPPGFAGAGPPHSVTGDRRVLVATLRRPLPDGLYVVRWRVLSTDSHTTQGAFRFQVAR